MIPVLASDDNYRVYTRRFDRVVSANDLAWRASTERAWARLMEDTLELRTRWELEALQQSARLRSSVGEHILRDAIVTLLVDHSGSMRGERMLLAATAIDVARAFLVHTDVSVEVLGFTTRSWKGGWSRRLWRWTGKRKRPGRLCDLLHIIYADAADHRPGSGVRSLVHMLDPQLLKENVDGEALLWAAQRQDRQPKKTKVLVLVSDGAPVDDSTLHANGANYLIEHLHEVVATLHTSRSLAHLQIGDEAKSPIELTRKVDTLAELGPELLGLLVDALARSSEQLASGQ